MKSFQSHNEIWIFLVFSWLLFILSTGKQVFCTVLLRKMLCRKFMVWVKKIPRTSSRRLSHLPQGLSSRISLSSSESSPLSRGDLLSGSRRLSGIAKFPLNTFFSKNHALHTLIFTRSLRYCCKRHLYF